MRIAPILTFTASALTAASAIVLPRDDCNTGTVQCCKSVQSANATGVAEMLNVLRLLGLPIDVGAILASSDSFVGTSCNSVSAAGTGEDTCSSQPVCCADNHWGGVIATHCNPVNINP